MTSGLLHRVAVGGSSTEDPIKSLSNREIEVYEMIGQGLTIQQIAARLHLSPKTIETHHEKIKQKPTSNSTELNRHAVQWVLEGGAKSPWARREPLDLRQTLPPVERPSRYWP